MEVLFQRTWACFFTFPTNMGLFFFTKNGGLLASYGWGSPFQSGLQKDGPYFASQIDFGRVVMLSSFCNTSRL